MDIIGFLGLGFSVALDPINILYCFIGVLLGTLVGVLPGIGPTATIAMLLPITFSLSPAAALIMLAGIYYGAQYGGSTTAILINLPGESSSAVTAIDGYQMAKQGRAGHALATAALGSFFAGTVARSCWPSSPRLWRGRHSVSVRPNTSRSSSSASSSPLPSRMDRSSRPSP